MFSTRGIRSTAGFTLLELIIVMAIFAVLGGLGLFISLDFYTANALYSERDTVVVLLRRARSDALSDIGGSPHGIFIGPSEYVLFRGSSYAARDPAFDETQPRPAGLSFSGLDEVVFEPLSATSTASGTITLSNDSRNANVSVNHEGAIDW